MPLYVQRAFVVKMFGALALQILTCLALMLPIHRLCEQFHFMAYVPNNGTSTSVFADVMPMNQPGILLGFYYGLSFLCMMMLVVQWWLRNRHPINYFCAFLSTVLVGCFFGISDEMLLVQIHTRLLSVVVTTMTISCISCWLFLRDGWCRNLTAATLVSIGLGWIASTLLVMLVSQVLDPVNSIGKTCTAALLSAFVLTFLLVHSWNSLMNCKVDDLVGIIAVMDASLLAVVSLPFLFLLLAFCAPSSAMQVQNGEANEAQNQV